jgi:hypothetical protein
MSATKHTAGPWQVTFGKTLLHIETANVENAPPEWEAGIAICSVPKSKMANAKLIAAAPELLSALEGLLPWLERKGMDEWAHRYAHQVRAAIQLATE